jgi:hypothetical protein
MMKDFFILYMSEYSYIYSYERKYYCSHGTKFSLNFLIIEKV